MGHKYSTLVEAAILRLFFNSYRVRFENIFELNLQFGILGSFSPYFVAGVRTVPVVASSSSGDLSE